MHHAVRSLYPGSRSLHTYPIGCRWSTRSGLTGNTGSHQIFGRTRADLFKPLITWRNTILIQMGHLPLWVYFILLFADNQNLIYHLAVQLTAARRWDVSAGKNWWRDEYNWRLSMLHLRVDEYGSFRQVVEASVAYKGVWTCKTSMIIVQILHLGQHDLSPWWNLNTESINQWIIFSYGARMDPKMELKYEISFVVETKE